MYWWVQTSTQTKHKSRFRKNLFTLRLKYNQKSSFYESEAFGMEGDNFINAVIYLKSKKNHKEILIC